MSEPATSERKPCAICGVAPHRYGTTDLEHKYDALACVNGLRPMLEEANRRLDRVRDAFGYMPALHGAYGPTVDELRQEVNDALSRFWPDLCAYLVRPDVARLLGYEKAPKMGEADASV